MNVKAQLSEMTLEQVVSMTLSNNLDIQIAQNKEEVAGNLATKGQAGYLPSLGLNGAASYSNNNTNLEFAGGIAPVEVNGAQNTAVSAGIGLNYVVFNGFGRVNTYQALMSSHQLSELQARVLAENLTMDALNRFLDIQQNSLNLQTAYENLTISKDRYERTKIAVEAGAKNKLDLINAELDLNNDELAVESLIAAIEKQKAALNVLMGRDPYTPFFVSANTPIPDSISFDQAKELAMANNANIIMAQVSTELSEQNRKVIQSAQMPQLSMNASYGAQQSQNGAGIILSQKTLGFTGGFNLSIPIFNGGQLTTALKNAELNQESSEIELQKSMLSIQNEIKAAELDMGVVNASIKSQSQNVALASLALERAQISYKAGQISTNDLRLAQLNLMMAKNNLNDAVMSKIRLKYNISRLTGKLIAQ